MIVSGAPYLYDALCRHRARSGIALDLRRNAPKGPLAEIVVRNWGALIALSGGMLIYGAFHPPVRTPILTFAALGN